MKSQFPRNGKVTFICLRPERMASVDSVTTASADTEQGLVGDHFSGKPGDARMVTLIQQEHIELVGALMDREVDPSLLRRNIVVQGINLLALKGQQFQIGDAIFEGTTACPPCSRMEENLGTGGYNAMRGHGGINAKVIRSGSFSVGDALMVTDTPAEPTDNE